jgi:opacity protein-like surface antigen
VLTLAAMVSVVALPAAASAQWLPEEPVTALGGRLAVSGDAAIGYSTSDHDTYFNYGDYQLDMMRLVRLGVRASLRAGARATVTTDVRAEGEVEGGPWRVYPISLALEVRPFAGSSFAVAGGVVQPAFGSFTQRRYGADNLLIGYPLAYQYTTAVRADAIPASANEVLANRARGWAPRYTIGAGRGVSGLPVVNTSGWSPGVAVSGATERFTGKLAVTRGGLAAPGSAAWHGRWEVTGRAEFKPTVGLVLGVSGARGAFIDDALSPVVATAVENRSPRETAFGVDVEYSWGYWLVRGEAILGRRAYPAFVAPDTSDPLSTTALEVEARYKIRPGLYAAARLGGLWFGQLHGSTTTRSWDANTIRVETGLGYSITRNVLVKAVYQYNRRDATHEPILHLGAAQLVARF